MHHVLHLVFEVGAFIAGYSYYSRLRRLRGDPILEEARVWIIIGAAAGALIGSRVLGALEDPGVLAWNWNSLFIALNNRTIVGGLLGGLIGVEMTKRIINVRQRSGDLFVFPLILGMIIGRVGCLLGGLEDNTYGIATGLPWGMDLGDGVRRHPTNIYEILYLFLLWAGLAFVQRRFPLAPGALFKLFMVDYLFFRLCIEFIKPAPEVWLGLTSIQLATGAGLLYYYRVWLRPAHLIAPADA